jgi:hypothetical protein
VVVGLIYGLVDALLLQLSGNLFLAMESSLPPKSV